MARVTISLLPATLEWLKTNPLGIADSALTLGATIRAILEDEQNGNGNSAVSVKARAEKLAELTERVEKLEAAAEASNPQAELEDYPADYVNPAKQRRQK